MTEAVFGKVDVTWKEIWRLSAGMRWEDYKQVALDHRVGQRVAIGIPTVVRTNIPNQVTVKDVTNPIEFFESAASDTTVAREIVNATTAEVAGVAGVEVEALKELSFLSGTVGSWIDSFFVQANLTVQDSELVAGENADAPTNVRPLAGASEYVANAMFGYDSYDGNHTATLVYNVFGERLYVAGRLGAPDGYEQPFHSLDFTYSWYPTEFITVKAKLRNMLDGTAEIEREGIVVFSERPGSSASLSFKWEF